MKKLLFLLLCSSCTCSVVKKEVDASTDASVTSNYTGSDASLVETDVAEEDFEAGAIVIEPTQTVVNDLPSTLGAATWIQDPSFKFESGSENEAIYSSNNVKLGVVYSNVKYDSLDNFYIDIESYFSSNFPATKSEIVKINGRDFISHEFVDDNEHHAFLNAYVDEKAYMFSCGGVNLSQTEVDVCNNILNSIVFVK